MNKMLSFKLVWLFVNFVTPQDGCVFLVDKKDGEVFADCRGLGLRHVPHNFPPRTVSISLDFNMIQTLKDNSFANLPNLKQLDLSHNQITTLEKLAFRDCQNLSHLDLSWNMLKLDNVSYPDTVFDSLENLQRLDLGNNKYIGQSGNMSGRIFTNLRKLRSLSMDVCDEVYFGEGFSRMTSLKSLSLFGEIRILQNNTFLNLRDIEVECLNIIVHEVETIQTGTFAPLQHMSEFSIRHCRQGIRHVMKVAHSFSRRCINIVNMSHIAKTVKELPAISDSKLDADTLRYITHLCIKQLNLAANHLIYVDIMFLRNTTLSTCLTYIDLSQNWLLMNLLILFFSPTVFPNIEHVDVSAQRKGSVCKPYVSRDTFDDDLLTEGFHAHYTFRLPINLSYVNAASTTRNMGYVDRVTIVNGESLRVLNLSFVGLKSVTGDITGLYNLKSLDISGNKLMRLSDDVFKSTGLEHLYLNYFSLPQDAVSKQGRQLLQPLGRLRTLHLSFNRLWHLPPYLFSANPMLEYIDLSNNIFQLFPFDLTDVPLLNIIDLSSNTLGYIQTKTQKQITKHIQRLHKNVSFFLDGNILGCACESFEFLSWLKETSNHFSNGHNFTCLLANGHISNTVEVFGRITHLWRECTGFTVLFITVTMITVFVASVFVVLLIKTNKTVVVNTFITLLKKQLQKPTRWNFRHDVYLAYAEADYQWACHCLGPLLEDSDLRVFLWDRDSVPGDSAPDQIAENVIRSWKVVVYFTEAYLRDQWWYLTMMTALSGVDSASPDRLIVLLPEWEKPLIPDCISSTVPERCIVRVPEDVMFNHSFWDDLLDILKKD